MENTNSALDRLYQLININLTINDNYDNFDVVLQRLLNVIEVVTKSEVTSLLVYESNRKNLYFKFATGDTAHDLIGLRVPHGKGIAHSVSISKKGVIVNNPEEFGYYNNVDQKIDYKTRNLMAFPVLDNNGEIFGIVETCNKKNNESYTEDDFQLLSIFCQQAEKTIRHALHIHTLNQRNIYLNNMIKQAICPPLVAESKEMKNNLNLINKISKTNTPVLITGEPGTGKSLVAYHIHYGSYMKEQMLVEIDCYELRRKYPNDDDLRIHLWGVEKNSKLGIKQSSEGLFRKAIDGTVIIDGIDILPIVIQKEIKKLLLHKLFKKVYASEWDILEVRTICITSKNINTLIQNKEFDEDLFFLINSLSIHLSPINTRLSDLQSIAKYYFDFYIKKYKKNIKEVAKEVYLILKRYIWEYNIYSLIQAIEVLVLYCEDTVLSSAYVSDYMFKVIEGKENAHSILEHDTDENITLKEAINKFKTQYIHKVLLKNNWNHTKTSRALDIQRSYLSRLVKEYDLKKKRNYT